MLRSRILLMAMLLAQSATGSAREPDETLHFTSEDVAVIKEIRRVEEAADLTAGILLGSPAILLYSSGNLGTFTLTLGSVDFDRIGRSASAVQTIAACRLRDRVVMHLEPALSDKAPTGAAREYFLKVSKIFAERCGGQN